MSRVLGGARQIGYVVTDIDRAMCHWIDNLGVGPFFYREKANFTELTYYGVPLETLPDISFAFANTGYMQVELIEQHDDVPTIYRDFLERMPGGLHHTAYWTDDEFDSHLQRLLSRGFVNVMDGRMGESGRFAYFEHADDPGNYLELSEQAGGKGEFFSYIAKKARDWDGSRPIRVLKD